jgi:hypothetical protein
MLRIAVLVLLSTFWEPTGAEPTTIVVYRSPSCGCCLKWVDHLRTNGFSVKVHDVSQADLDSVKIRHNVPRDLQSCHTAVSGEYVIEGHVPASDVKRLLQARPRLRGVAVPKMPAGSPGMESPTGRRQAYAVLGFGDGKPSVFASHP